MKQLVIGLPTFGFIVATRAALGSGIGLLAANKLSERRRRAVGLILLAVGAVSTVPAALAVARAVGRSRPNGGPMLQPTANIVRDERLIGAERFPRKGDDD